MVNGVQAKIKSNGSCALFLELGPRVAHYEALTSSARDYPRDRLCTNPPMVIRWPFKILLSDTYVQFSGMS